jgi:hypothetical protein
MNIETVVLNKWLLTSAEERWPIRCIRFLSFGKFGNLPHGVKLVFHNEASALRGATINWRSGDEEPLANLRFDGSVVEFQMEPGTPILRMTVANDQFEGYSISPSGETLGPKLKMIKYVGL